MTVTRDYVQANYQITLCWFWAKMTPPFHLSTYMGCAFVALKIKLVYLPKTNRMLHVLGNYN